MYIGLIDFDLLTNKKRPPNLELMKLSAYYKFKRNIVELVRNCKEWERYSQIELFKNVQDQTFPSVLINEMKPILHGEGFFGEKYIPYSEEIENSLPDISIYGKATLTPTQKAWLQKNQVRLETERELKIPRPSKNFLVYDREPQRFEMLYEVLDHGLTELLHPAMFDSLDAAARLAANKNIFGTSVSCCNKIVTSQDVKNIADSYEFKGELHVSLFPSSYADVGNKIGIALIASKIDEMEEILRCRKIFINNIFKDPLLHRTIDYINGIAFQNPYAEKLLKNQQSLLRRARKINGGRHDERKRNKSKD